MVLDLLIIGAGPAGMTAALYAKRKGLDILVIAESVGGQVATTGAVENYPGFPSIPGPGLVDAMKRHVEDLQVVLKRGRVAKLERAGDHFRATAADGQAYEARAVIIASGSKWRELGVPGEREFRNRGVSYCPTCDGPLFAGMDVAVVGSGNSAAEAVIDLIPVARKVFMVVRHEIKADKAVADRIRGNAKAEIIQGYAVERIRGGDFVEAVDIVSSSGERRSLGVGGVFVEVGMDPNVAFARGLVDVNDRGEIIVDGRCRTSACGVFAAGDVTDVPQKQIVVAAGEGAKAAIAAFAYIGTQKC